MVAVALPRSGRSVVAILAAHLPAPLTCPSTRAASHRIEFLLSTTDTAVVLTTAADAERFADRTCLVVDDPDVVSRLAEQPPRRRHQRCNPRAPPTSSSPRFHRRAQGRRRHARRRRQLRRRSPRPHARPRAKLDWAVRCGSRTRGRSVSTPPGNRSRRCSTGTNCTCSPTTRCATRADSSPGCATLRST